MADKIPCFAKVNMPDLAKLFDSKYKEGMSESEQRQIGTDIALEYHKQLHEELNTFKKSIKAPTTAYVSPDKSEAIKAINDQYSPKIAEAKLNEKGVSLTKIQSDANDIITGKKVFERFSQEEQHGLTDGGANHVEAALILAANEKTGRPDNPDTQLQESNIEDYARSKGIWYGNTTTELTNKLGEQFKSGEEAVVWRSEDGTKVVKSQSTDMYGGDLQQKLDGITLHNLISPEAPLKVIGFGRDAEGNFNVVVEQPFIHSDNSGINDIGNPAQVAKKQKLIKEYLGNLGFENTEGSNYSNGEILLEDVHNGNAIITPKGNVVIIDPISRLNNPEQGYGGTRKIKNEVNEANANANTENKQSEQQPKEESKPVEPVVEDSKGAGKEPPKPPEKEKVEDEGGKLNDKGILNKLYNAKGTPQAAKEGFKKEGLEYQTKSQEESEMVAKSVVDELGIEDAVLAAQAMKFDGDVNSLIFGEALNRLKEQEDAATTPEAKLEAAMKFAEVGITYDKMARYGGRFNAAINRFYKKSPLGIVIMENAKRKEDFTQWSKPKDKSWKEFYDELVKEPEFDAIIKEQVKEDLKTERAEARKARIKKVDDFFDKAKDQFKGGALYSTVIPPKVITTALEGMKKAYHAGEKVAKLIEDAVDYISEQLGNAPWDKEKFRNEWGEKLADKAEKKPLTDAEVKTKVLDKFRKKLNGLTDKQKDQVIAKAHRKLIENGALEYEDFKSIISQVIGKGELTAAEVARMKDLVAKTNAIEAAAERIRTERTPESFVDFRAAQIEAGRAAKELNELFYNKPDIVKRLTSIMQLSTLGIPALVNNPIYNIWNQATLRFPIGVVNTLIDKGISVAAKTVGKTYDREYNIIAGQAEFWQKLGMGAKESFEQFGTGLNRQDYTAKEVYGQQIRPFKSLRDLYDNARGKRKLTHAQYWDKLIQGTAGIPAEVVARVLNLGDKPQRFAAEGSQAAAFAKILGLKEMDYKIFVEFPREEAYRAYKAQGLSDEVAGQKADYIKEAIIKEGQRSTFQQENLLNDVINAASGKLFGKDSGASNLAKALVISPYIKIPSNAFWSMYNLINPEVAFLQAGIHAGRSRVLNKKGELTKSKLANREARYWMAHAIVGIGMRAVVISLVQAGAFTPGSDEDDSKKERDAVSFFDKPGTVTIDGVKISNRWFGQWGMMGNAMAKKWRDATPEQREAQNDFWNIAFGGMEVDALKELENGIFANSSSLLQTISSGNPDRYLLNTINMMANIVQPASIAQANRAALDEVPSSRGDSFLDKLNNNFAQRSTLYRKVFNVQLDAKRDIWGQKMSKGGNILTRMFGISKAEPQLFGRPIYNDFLDSGDSGFLPPAVLPILNGQKLNTKQYDRLQDYIGSERKRIVEPYVNDMVEIPGRKQKYSEIKDDEVKKGALKTIYDEGRKKGLEKFYSDYPEFRTKPKTEQEVVEDKKTEASNKTIRRSAKKHKNE